LTGKSYFVPTFGLPVTQIVVVLASKSKTPKTRGKYTKLIIFTKPSQNEGGLQHQTP
jgi:hypothetical protein